ncbi:Sensor protein RstB [Rubripirellula tenax]|uniref:histidine kinase n=1 Tax=Rubripirellula tenax TaxID=2528015 RepID=A0A5C6EDU3_9BACT|nr:ATP-binding protein [Rubripirellula tenax]TWU46167.1 Sensor protein RstB [Rubripirellula tenax]
MTRLFLRFYLGVLLILFVAWLIQAYVFRGTTQAKNIAVIEDALSGGAISARDDLIDGGKEKFAKTLEQVRGRFAYPVMIVDREARPMAAAMNARIERGEAVFHWGKIDVAITGTDQLVEFGPLPEFVGPAQSDVLLGLGSVFLLAAGAIAVLLRPIARQFRNVERTALAIASGDLSARIDGGNKKGVLPIVGAFNNMADRVESLLRSQKELLQAVSHELRTPLARIRFATELVRSADDRTKRELRIDSIDEATDKLDKLVGELLEYTRHDSGTEAVDREQVSLDSVVSEAIQTYEPLYPAIDFQSIQSPNQAELSTNRVTIQRAVDNLVSNAGKYAHSKVVVGVSKQDQSYCIFVEEDGDGIPPEDRQSVFEPFRRLSGDSHPGTGLGLALVRRICELLGGDVNVTDSPLGGAKFMIRLPSDS